MRTLRNTLIALVGVYSFAPIVQADMTVGIASPMDKVMIEGGHNGWPFEGQWADEIGYAHDLAMARNEHEAVQVVVTSQTGLSNARVTVSALQPQGGQGAFTGDVQVWLVGHVDASDDPPSNLNIGYPPYLDGYTGYWPDPLLTFTNACNIAAGDRVAFWVNVETTADTPAGDYLATITVEADDVDPVDLQLNVHVWDFTLPPTPSFRTAFSAQFWMASSFYGSDWNTEMRDRFWDLQMAHRLSLTEIYRNTVTPETWIDYWVNGGTNSFALSAVCWLRPSWPVSWPPSWPPPASLRTALPPSGASLAAGWPWRRSSSGSSSSSCETLWPS